MKAERGEHVSEPEIITLKSGEAVAMISTAGAWLESYTVNGRPVIFPKQKLEIDGKQKDRGGSHVCLPNFGPGGDSGQPQHGYGRTVEWNLVDKTDTTAVFGLERGVGHFQALGSRLRYQLRPDGFEVELSVTNEGNWPLPVSPGFHPYFTVTGAGDITINGQAYRPDQLGEAQYIRGERMDLEIGNTTYQLESGGLPVWALWSDRPDEYVCLEPTAAGASFETNHPPLLHPNHTLSSTFAVRLGAADGA